MMEDSIPNELKTIGAEIADEVRNGLWDSKTSMRPVRDSKEVYEYFQKKCPGYSSKEYDDALAYGFFVTR